MRFKNADELLREANCGYVGINAELHVVEGFDGSCSNASLDAETRSQDELDGPRGYDRPWPRAEMLKLANAMLHRWTEYRKAALRRPK